MKIISCTASLVIISVLVTSCKMECSVGNNEAKKSAPTEAHKPVHQDGATIFNGIELTARGIKVSKAYLTYENGERIQDDNFVDFSSGIKLIVMIDSGWTVIDDRVYLGASEKVVSESGRVLLDEKDLFAAPEGYSPVDAKIIGISFTLELKKGSPPTYYTVSFRIWDKKGEGYVDGSYRVYTK